jgi:3-oxoacyl-(acyl-carrier-protein) synthase
VRWLFVANTVRDHFSANHLFNDLKNYSSLITEDNRLKILGINNVPSASLTEHNINYLNEKTKKYINGNKPIALIFLMAYSTIIDALQSSNLSLDLTNFNSELFFANNKIFPSETKLIQLVTKFKYQPESFNDNFDIEEFCKINQATKIFDEITKCLNLSTIPRIYSDACIAGQSALYSAYLNVKNKNRDIAIVCASEEATHPIMQLIFKKIGALYDNKKGIPISNASRAFDKQRSGCVLADGAACIVVESLSSAKARGAKVIAEIKGMSRRCEAYKITSSDESGKYYIEAMEEAISDAGLKPENIDFINAHGTST